MQSKSMFIATKSLTIRVYIWFHFKACFIIQPHHPLSMFFKAPKSIICRLIRFELTHIIL